MTPEPPVSFSASVPITQIKIKETIEKLMLVLSEKERYIIEHRFSIGTNSKNTLEAIGQHFGVTRERIRQIEKNALKKLKRNAFNTHLKVVNEFAKNIIKKHGGLLVDKKLINSLLGTLKTISADEINELKLSLTLDPEVTRAFNTLNFEPHWRFNTLSFPSLQKISNATFSILNEKTTIVPLESLVKEVIDRVDQKVSEALAISVMEIDKRFKFVKEGVGLKDWRHINPRTLRDKIHFIMEREHKPLHFTEIAEKIRHSDFDKKRINLQAVHNELIRNEHFVLIGRGLYALDKWGYEPGTVGDVIVKILVDGKSRTRDEIMKEVLKQRLVKKITIYLNLKNDQRIESLTGDRYRLAKGVKVKSSALASEPTVSVLAQEA